MRFSHLKASALAVLLSTTTLAHAQSIEDQVLTNLRDLGYTAFEIEKGPTQMKVEAYRGDEKIEVVYDLDSGRILKQERESAVGEDIPSDGVEIKQASEDFVDVDDEDESDEDDDRDDSDEYGSDDDSDDDNGSDRSDDSNDEGDDD